LSTVCFTDQPYDFDDSFKHLMARKLEFQMEDYFSYELFFQKKGQKSQQQRLEKIPRFSPKSALHGRTD
jgi:hypothetical protein